MTLFLGAGASKRFGSKNLAGCKLKRQQLREKRRKRERTDKRSIIRARKFSGIAKSIEI